MMLSDSKCKANLSQRLRNYNIGLLKHSGVSIDQTWLSRGLKKRLFLQKDSLNAGQYP